MTSKISILKNSVLIAMFALLPLAAAKASAQAKDVVVDVPFAFVANHTSFPAGHYQIVANGSFLTFNNADTGTSEGILMSRTEASHTASGESKVDFYVSGDRHVLTDVQFGRTGTRNVLLRQPKPEHLVAENAKPSAQTLEIWSR